MKIEKRISTFNKTIEVTEERDVYVADDGTVFNTEWCCIGHDKDTKCIKNYNSIDKKLLNLPHTTSDNELLTHAYYIESDKDIEHLQAYANRFGDEILGEGTNVDEVEISHSDNEHYNWFVLCLTEVEVNSYYESNSHDAECIYELVPLVDMQKAYTFKED